ncbi:protogenin-like isoform X2 [Argopecten irradians]
MFNITCKATGNPTPSVTWLKDGEPFPNTSERWATSFGVLVFTEADRSILGTYQCLAINGKGASISPEIAFTHAMLTNFPATSQQTITKTRYQYLALPCIGRPQCTPASACKFEWKRGGEKLPSEDRIFVDNEGTLHFTYLEQSDDHSYACGVWNGQLNLHTRSPQSTVLTVSDSSPSIHPPALMYSRNVTGDISRSGRLQCVFSGYPLPAISWLDNNGKIISNNDVFSLQDNGQSLMISSLTLLHEGFYTCIGLQRQTSARAEGKVYLNVTGPPVFEAGAMDDQVATVGSYVQYSCLSRSLRNETHPEVPEWYHNGQKISIYGPGEKFSLNGTKLIVNNLEKNDTSLIQCMVQNSVGHNFREARLVVIDPITVTNGLQDYIELTLDVPVSVHVSAVTDPRLSLTYNWSVYNGITWTNLPTGVTISDDRQNITFSPNSRNIQELVGVYMYRVVIQHAFDLVILETNVTYTAPPTTKSISSTKTTEVPSTTTSSATSTTSTTTPSTTISTTIITTDAPTTEKSTTHPRTFEQTKPPTGSLEDEHSNSAGVIIVIIVVIVVVIVLVVIIAAVYHRRRRLGTITIAQPLSTVVTGKSAKENQDDQSLRISETQPDKTALNHTHESSNTLEASHNESTIPDHDEQPLISETITSESAGENHVDQPSVETQPDELAKQRYDNQSVVTSETQPEKSPKECYDNQSLVTSETEPDESPKECYDNQPLVTSETEPDGMPKVDQ